MEKKKYKVAIPTLNCGFVKKLRENHYFYDFKWSSNVSDGFIVFYDQKTIYTPIFLVRVHVCLILEEKILIFQRRGPDW